MAAEIPARRWPGHREALARRAAVTRPGGAVSFTKFAVPRIPNATISRPSLLARLAAGGEQTLITVAGVKHALVQ